MLIATDTFKSGLLSRETIILDGNLVEQNIDNDLVQAQDVTHSSEARNQEQLLLEDQFFGIYELIRDSNAIDIHQESLEN